MSTEHTSVIGKVLYGVLFTVALPALLVCWAIMTENTVRLPAFGSLPIGASVAALGVVVMGSGMYALLVYGKGLPMNAYPPVRYVTQGIYRITSHPIYVGFSALCIGVAIAAHSSSGLWLVSPFVILGTVALVEGYEKHDLRRRFGVAIAKPLLHIPADETTPPAFTDRLSVYVLVLAPWLILYEAVRFIGIPSDAIVAFFPFEESWPVYEWTEVFYVSTYAFVLLAPLVARTNHDLRNFLISALIATGLIILLFLAVPFIAPPRPFVPNGPLGALLARERAYDTPAAAFPSFHAVWALLAAAVYVRSMPSLKGLWWAWAALISVSCVTTGMHAIVDIASGFVVFAFVTRRRAVWGEVRRLTERIANSWREWRVGPVRFINHGLYAGAGAFIALSIVGTLIGPQYIPAMMIVAASVLITAAIWAQLVEGSPSLLRPYGWYGGLLGALIGAFIASLLGASPWLLLASFSVSAPWVQSAGRLRCLVQGCCHGREAPATIGISYKHPRSRVCKLAGLTGVPVHATPLYSIIWNMIVAVVIARLWFLCAPLSLIIGVYLIITRLGRFVEESYRGEPQTAVYGGLRFYQWLAILSVVSGILTTMVDNTPSPPAPQLNWESSAAAGSFAVLTACALGLDFPESNKRFARLG
jgi:membrane-associated phospholipid phosphatase/protein-S-isoprenylcysteine O-methyltransferase Ste14